MTKFLKLVAFVALLAVSPTAATAQTPNPTSESLLAKLICTATILRIDGQNYLTVQTMLIKAAKAGFAGKNFTPELQFLLAENIKQLVQTIYTLPPETTVAMQRKYCAGVE